MPAQLSDVEKAAYRALMRVVLAIPRAINAEIAIEGGFGISDHLALEYLAGAPDRQMRMSELAVACGVSMSGITRIVNRLDDAGLTARARTQPDARGAAAVLTPVGVARLEQVQTVHLASIRRHIVDHLGNVDLAAFTFSMEGIASSALPGNGGRGGRRSGR